MSGTAPAFTNSALQLINAQKNGISTTSVLQGGGSAFGSLAGSGALGAALQGSKAIPIVGSIIAIGTTILGAIFAKHAQKVKEEANTLDGAFPAWRELLVATVDAYNNGQVSSQQAIDYVEQARGLWYQQVQGIMKGKPGGGASFSEYQQVHGKFAPIDPCNGACFISYYYVEPEAAMVKQALGDGKSATIELAAFNIRNGDSEPATTLQIQPSPLSLLPASLTSNLPPIV